MVQEALKRSEEALARFQRALQLKPNSPVLLNDRGNVLLSLGRLDEALASYDEALAVQPDFLDALNNRGHVLQTLRRPGEALASYDKALAVQPDHPAVLNNRGNTLQALRRHGEALTSYDKALAIKPDYPEALNNRANMLLALGRLDEALASYDRALAIKPAYAEALNNRGTTLRALNRLAEALASYDRALTIKPAYAEALNNRGTALRALGRGAEALESFGRALAVKPDYAQALYNRGNLLRHLYGYEKAIPDYQRAVQLAPNMRAARGMLLHAKLHCCDWDSFQQQRDLVIKDVQAGKPASAPFVFLGLSGDAAEQLRCSQIWVGKNSPASPKPAWTGKRYRHDRIRVAYLSADFRDHPVTQSLVEVLERHDRKRFETIGVSFTTDSDNKVYLRVKNAFERFIGISKKTDREAANMLRDLEVDIAVDLMGFTQFHRMGIFAIRPVPIQVGYLGFVGTTGAEYIDYILADRYVIPPELQACYTEKVVYLPDTFQPNPSSRGASGRIPTRAEVGLPEMGFVFCSINNNYKFTPSLFDIWMRLLSQVDGSVLWLLANNAAVERNLRREAQQRGIAPERLIFTPRVDYADYLARYGVADLFLDTLPYNACTTATDALSAGVPVVTCAGEAFAARMAGSLLHTLGLPELVASSLQDYERMALKLAFDGKALADIRARLARNLKTSPLFDAERFRRSIEAAYVTMWQRQQRGEPPASFAVEPNQ